MVREKRIRTILMIVALAIIAAGCGSDNPVRSRPDLSSEPFNWSTQHLPLTDNSLSGVAFVDSSHGWAVGTGGTVYRTIDGGRHWVWDSIPASGNWNSAQYANHTIWVTGTAGLFVRGFGDVGWHRGSLNATGLRGLTFLNDREGWIVGDAGQIYHTTDGGSSWVRQESGVTALLTAVSFANPRDGCVAGYKGTEEAIILTTHDGGATWSLHKLDGDRYVMAIQALSADVILAGGVITIWSGGDPTHRGFLTRSIDGGQTWSADKLGQAYSAFHFDSPREGIAAGSRTIMLTRDGGETWEPYGDTYFGIYDLQFLSPTTVVAVGDYGCTGRSDDGGRTWELSTCFLFGNPLQVQVASPDLVAVSGQFEAMMSLTGGETWEAAVPPGFKSIDFVDRANGLMLSTWNCIYRTNDGGRTWDSVSYLGIALADAIDFADTERGLLVANTAVYKTADGGRTWSLAHSTPGVRLYDVCFGDSHHGWAVGLKGMVLRTSDGGDTWAKVANPDSLHSSSLLLAKCQFFDSANGIAFSNNTTAYRTRDGGASWEPLPLPDGLEYLLGDFADTLHGVLGDREGFLYHTDDGGQAWVQDDVPGRSPILSVSASNDNGNWAVRVDGTVISTRIERPLMLTRR